MSEIEERRSEAELLKEHGVDADDPQLDQAIRAAEAGATEERPYGEPGRPLARRSPFQIAAQASIGVLVVIGLAYLAYSVRGILLIVLVALFLTFGLAPAAEWFRRRGLGAGLSAAAVVLLFAVVVGGSAVVGLPPLVRQANELWQQFPRYTRDAIEDSALLRDLDQRFQLVQRVETLTGGGATDQLFTNGPPPWAFGLALSVARGVFGVVTALVLTLYFLANHRELRRGAYALVPRSRRARVTLLSDEILDRIALYVLGNLVTSVIAGVTAGVFLSILGVPYAAALGLIVGLTDMIPLVGATIGAVASCLVAFAVSFTTGLIAVGFFVAYQQFENWVVVPRVMRRAVAVSPAAVIVAVLIGGSLLGVIGALMAVPVAAAVQLIATEVVVPRQEAL